MNNSMHYWKWRQWPWVNIDRLRSVSSPAISPTLVREGIATLPRPITIGVDVKFCVTGVPRRNSLKKATCERGGPTVGLATPRYRSYRFCISFPCFFNRADFPRWSFVSLPSLCLHSCSLVTKGARAPWPQRPINSLQRGCVSRIEPSTGPSKPTYDPTTNGVHAFILLQPRCFTKDDPSLLHP